MFTLISKLEDVEDPRSGNARCHKLSDILFMAIAAAVAGADTWYDIADFAESHLSFFKKYLELPGGIPSHDTFNRVFSIIDPAILEAHYQEWIADYIKLKAGDIVSIDGKTIRGAGERGDEGYVHMVSACESESGISLGQIKVDEKSNEITAVPKLLDMLDVKGCTITMDAMGCQKSIAEKIVEKKAHYLLAVKENQHGLLEGIKETEQLCNPSCKHYDLDCDHGRVEERTCRVYRDLSCIRGSWNWAGLSAVVVQESKRYDKKTGSETVEKRYYITNMPRGRAASIAYAIRSHWSVENKLHWALDVTLGEDRSSKKRCNAAENFSRLMRVVLFLLRRDKKRCIPGCNKSLQRKRKTAGWDENVLERLLFAPPPEENAQ